MQMFGSFFCGPGRSFSFDFFRDEALMLLPLDSCANAVHGSARTAAAAVRGCRPLQSERLGGRRKWRVELQNPQNHLGSVPLHDSAFITARSKLIPSVRLSVSRGARGPRCRI
ncbi:hypothetical protein AOLI_G00161720 [Acnodon oligacanthus]